MINNDIDLCFTGDGSTGLYNKSVGDVYHSIYGAKNEAVDKFIKPLNLKHNFSNKSCIRVLDICYGIGYNTKAFLEEIIKLKINTNITIDLLEYDKNLVLLSPFVRDNIKINEIDYLILKALSNEYSNNNEIFSYILENKKFIKPQYRALIKKYRLFEGSYRDKERFKSFLHNIYYHYVSKRNKRTSKSLKINKIVITPYFNDARKTIKSLKTNYDIVFLDAFTPARLPTLWSLDFFIRLNTLMNDDALLVTYSNSAAVRNAMINAGFYVGKIFDKQKRPSGTIASKNQKLIINKLNDFDLGLLKTNAGVYYKDENLDSSPQAIIEEWETRKKNLNLQSSSSYIKNNKKISEEKCTIS